MKTCKHRLLIACVLGAICLVVVRDSGAQVPQRYEPARPTVSPYLNLFREQTGILPNYQSLVRPLQRQQEFRQAQRQFNELQVRAFNELQVELYEIQQQQAAGLTMTPTGKDAWFFRPSQRQKFMNTAGYYSQSRGAAVRTQR